MSPRGRVARLAARALPVAGLIGLALLLARLSVVWPGLVIHPEVHVALERSLDDLRSLAEVRPDREAELRRRFDATHRLLQRLRVLEHQREQIVGRYRILLLGLTGAAIAAVLLLARTRRKRLEARLERVGEALAALAAGRAPVRVDGVERGADPVSRIASMIEDTSNRVARDHRRLATLENLRSWQEAARRHAHEMRTPLTGARLEIERRLDAGPRDPEDRSALESVLEELDRLGAFVTAFTSFARLPRPRPRLLDLGEVVRRWSETYADAWPTMRIEGPRGDAGQQVSVDPEMLRQVLANLGENAARAGASRLLLEVTAELDGRPGLEVSDDGPGVAPELLDRLFEPYTTTREIGEGMGLGLAISRKILLDHGGELLLAETSGAGARFRLIFPPPNAPETSA